MTFIFFGKLLSSHMVPKTSSAVKGLDELLFHVWSHMYDCTGKVTLKRKVRGCQSCFTMSCGFKLKRNLQPRYVLLSYAGLAWGIVRFWQSPPPKSSRARCLWNRLRNMPQLFLSQPLPSTIPFIILGIGEKLSNENWDLPLLLNLLVFLLHPPSPSTLYCSTNIFN